MKHQRNVVLDQACDFALTEHLVLRCVQLSCVCFHVSRKFCRRLWVLRREEYLPTQAQRYGAKHVGPHARTCAGSAAIPRPPACPSSWLPPRYWLCESNRSPDE